ncbi:MAG: LPS assembly protein LptD, partial [Kangiellaceae bacterium]|nr:LPS assembly protein LptD [Kangiellaceae bacterium]
QSSYQEQLSGQSYQSLIDINLTQYQLDTGLRFERTIDGGRQTLIPRLLWQYTPFTDQSLVPLLDTFETDINAQSLFNANRFSGYDRIADQDQATVGLTSQWFDQDRQWLELSIGQAFYNKAPRVTFYNQPISSYIDRSYSNLVTSMVFQPSQKLRIASYVGYDPTRNETELSQLSINYEPSDDLQVNIGHRFRDRPQLDDQFAEQTDLSMVVALNDNWRFMGRWNYDLVERQDLDAMAGIEYSSCCWTLRLSARRYLNVRLDSTGAILDQQQNRYNDGLFFEFEFRGLGGGNQPGFRQRLNRSIWDNLNGHSF